LCKPIKASTNLEVTVDANPDANFKDGKIRATVRAKYTFGKIAKGNATVTAEMQSDFWSWRRDENKKVSKSVEVDGKKPVEFDIAEDLGIKDKNRERTVKIFATFTEELTQKEQNASATVTIHITPHKIDLKKSSNNFKPGLPFSVSAIVQYYDKDAPVTDNFNPLKYTIKYYYDVLRTCERKKYVQTTIGSGFGHHPVEGPKETYECREEHSHEEIKEVLLTNGLSKIDIDMPRNTTKVDVKAEYLETDASVNGISKEESASDQYIQIKSATERLVKKIFSNILR
jgi:hypothetical protein